MPGIARAVAAPDAAEEARTVSVGSAASQPATVQLDLHVRAPVPGDELGLAAL